LKEIPQTSPNLKILDISYNQIRQANLNLAQLEKFMCNLSLMSNLSFQTIHSSLTYLQLSYNQLSELPDFSQYTPQLEELDLNYNNISEFPTLPKTLKRLHIQNNTIENVPNLDKLLPNLIEFDISSNSIRKIPKLPQTIYTFIFEKCQISEIDPENDFPQLREFHTAWNRFETAPKIEFQNCFHYDLSYNCIKSISLDSIPPKTVSLSLSNNHISELDNQILEIPTLTDFKISFNLLTTFPHLIRSPLVQLHISCNKICSLPEFLPETLQVLYCSNCGLSELPDQMKNLPRLKILICDNNNLTQIPFLAQLVTFHCSFNKLKVFPFLSNTLIDIDLSWNEIIEFPSAFSFPVLTDLDLSHNLISSFPESFSFPCLSSLKLSCNPIKGTIPDSDKLEFLETVELVETSIIFSNLKAKEILVSSSKYEIVHRDNSNIKIIHCDSTIGYSEVRGRRETMEDSILIHKDKKSGIEFFGVFDGHGGSDTSRFCTFQFQKLLTNRNIEFTEDYVRRLFSTCQEDLEKMLFVDGSTAAFAALKDRELIIAHLGDSRVYVISDDGKIQFQTQDHRPTERKEFERIQRDR
jgi:Leucine-rich repeat (LRR) protein